ncbi:hypothetical protein PO002_37820 [Cupriavidus necator]
MPAFAVCVTLSLALRTGEIALPTVVGTPIERGLGYRVNGKHLCPTHRG